MRRIALLAVSVVALVAPPLAARADAPANEAQIPLFVPPATFPASTPFYVTQGFTCEDGTEPCLSGLTHFDLYLDGQRQPSRPDLRYGSDGTLLSHRDLTDYPSGLPSGPHTFRGEWYWLGSLVQTQTVRVDFTTARVVVPRGRSLHLAVVLDPSLSFTPSIRNAIQMAVESLPPIAGFRVDVEDVDAPCGATPDVVAANVTAADTVVTDPQTVAVVGHECSYGLGGCPSQAPTTALSLYERYGIVAINGSTTSACLSSVGPTVFDRTAVADPGFDAWYGAVQALPADVRWRAEYARRFGSAPAAFADLYYDATRLLLTRLAAVAQVTAGGLVVDRATLAQAVRHTTGFAGVTCTVSLDPATGDRIADSGQLSACAHPLVVRKSVVRARCTSRRSAARRSHRTACRRR